MAICAAVLLTGGAVGAGFLVSRGGFGGAAPAATNQTHAATTNGAVGAATPTAGGTVGASTTANADSPSPAVSSAAHGPVDASTPLAADDGTAVYTADFGDKGSGWPATSRDGLSAFAFTPAGYAITGLGGVLHHLVYSPQTVGVQQLSMSMTATLSSGSAGAGIGVTCRRGQGNALVSYELLILDDGRWFAERRNGPPSLGLDAVVISKGKSSGVPGVVPLSLTGMCATMVDGDTTRLVLFVDGKKIADVTDTTTLPSDGWLSGILVASGDGPATLTATSFDARDLAK